jgi:FlaA1/EpsC-like NDP-sugar epimerase
MHRDGPSSIPIRIVHIFRRDVPLAMLDLVGCLGAYLIPLIVRFDGRVPHSYWRSFWQVAPLVVLIHLVWNLFFGLYGQMWRYASVQEARRVVLSGFGGGLTVLGVGALLSNGTRPIPLSVIALGSTLSLMAFGAVRFQSRLFAVRRQSAAADRKRVLLVGAGEAGAMLLKDLQRNPSLGLDPVGAIDDDIRKVGRSLHGVAVLGTRAAIPSQVGRLKVDQVLLAIPSATSEVVRDIAALCEEADVPLKVLPTVRETMKGTVAAADVRELRIEDLLGRQQVATDLAAVASILRDRRVLITGAGGSIGAEIARQVAGFAPASLVLLDHDETHLHDLVADLGNVPGLTTALADVREFDRLLSVFLRHRPEVVFHAAAHKHVPLLEIHPEEAVRTNVAGTACVVDAAVATGVGRFVLISTDKAIEPISVMGASKRIAEEIVRTVNGNRTVFCAVRFGNVLGSRGSVIPTFLRQIARGGPVTVTDPSMTRYFMSVQEAVELVLQASALASGGEVFTLDMGEPVNIMDLARKVVRLSGHVPGKDIEIVIVGPRPGEKLVEEIIDLTEEVLPSGHPQIVVSRPPLPDPATLRQALRELEVLAASGDMSRLSDRVKALAAGKLGAVTANVRATESGSRQ